MKAVPTWVYYSVYRVLMFAVPLVVLLLLRIDPLVATLLAAVIGLCLSYIFLRKPRESISRDLYRARHGDKKAARRDEASDAETEDAALDRQDDRQDDRQEATRGGQEGTPDSGQGPTPDSGQGPLSEGERESEQDSVGETGEARELQRKNQLP
jgi:hypothetical protein